MALNANDNVEDIIPHKNAKHIRNAAAVNNEINKRLLNVIKNVKKITKEEDVAYINIAALNLDLKSIERFINIVNNGELAVPFSEVIEHAGEKIDFVKFFNKKTDLDEDFIEEISNCTRKGLR